MNPLSFNPLDPMSIFFRRPVPSDEELLLSMEVVSLGARTNEGDIVSAVHVPWKVLIAELSKNPHFLHQFDPRKMEELIAAAYEQEGFDEVVLTPRSGDLGRDIIATRKGQFKIRLLDQVKRYAPGSPVPADDVRAMVGVLCRDPAASKAYVTTTSTFAPGVEKEFADMLPTRLELRTGKDLQAWFEQLAKSSAKKP